MSVCNFCQTRRHAGIEGSGQEVPSEQTPDDPPNIDLPQMGVSNASIRLQNHYRLLAEESASRSQLLADLASNNSIGSYKNTMVNSEVIKAPRNCELFIHPNPPTLIQNARHDNQATGHRLWRHEGNPGYQSFRQVF